MPIEFRCSQCNQLLRVPENSAGKNARCPKCASLMQVPAASALEAVAASATAEPVPHHASSSPPPHDPPPPAGKPSDDPFAFLSQPPSKPLPAASDPFGAKPSSAASASPFGPSPAAAPSMNPYATPSLAAGGYAPGMSYGPRGGLPWENSRQSLKAWWATATMVMGSPTRAFTQMRQQGGLGVPISYMIWSFAIPLIIALAIGVPSISLLVILTAGNDLLPALGVVLGITLAVIVGATMYILLISTVGMFISAGIHHLMLMIVGGAQRGFEATFRTTCFAQGSLAWLILIPYLGPMIMSPWMIVILILGLAQAHEISVGKSALAVFLPMIVVFGLFLLLLVVMIGLGAVGAIS
ncbi:MAG: YIP1 family protein [Pirellulaceae bacterium]